ncbi:MAG: aldehyde ferredoxin oxidoreductase C-terminal domain-containing protein [Gammaproteobacteria bacterium]
MTIRERIAALKERMHDGPQYPSQGKVLFVDLEKRTTDQAYIGVEVMKSFLGGRGVNMYLLYNLMQEGLDALDADIPLIFGTGVLSGNVPSASRGNVTSLSPDSDALLDSNAGDFFPIYMRYHGYDHIVLYGRHDQLTLLTISEETIEFHDATPYAGLDNIDLTAAVERDFQCKERKDMAFARITSAGENQVLCSGIMAGPKSIWARGGPGAKMGALRLKGILIHGKSKPVPLSSSFKLNNREIGKKILGTSVIRNALKTTGTPFLYKPSRTLGAMGTKNNQETTWVDDLDADNIDPYRPGMDGCYRCPVNCRPLNDMTPEGKGGWGASALKGLTGNASYDKAQVQITHDQARTYQGSKEDGVFDRYDKGDGPEYVTLGKLGPNIGIKQATQVLRLNNILNDLGLDSASTGSAIAWAMELYQRGIITKKETAGLDLSWGNFPVVEQLLFMAARREGFGDTIADSARAVARGKYPEQALDYRMAVKGLFQSDPHDARILKAFALGLAVATRGMDHLRNRVTLEINARINDDPEFKASLYGGNVAAEPNSYEGKEYAVRRCEDTFAVGDAVGMCRFDTKLFNSPNLPDCRDFAAQLQELTGIAFNEEELFQIGRNITGLERMINARRGLGEKDDTLPQRWFDEENSAGPFKGERIDRARFNELKQRFYDISGLDKDGLPETEWHINLSQALTGYAITVDLPEMPGIDTRKIIIDNPVKNISELRDRIKQRLPQASEYLDDVTLGVSVNDEIALSGEDQIPLKSGDQVMFVPQIAGG